MANLVDRTKIQFLWRKASTSGGTGAASTYIDVSGWNGCAFIVHTCTHLDTTGSFVVRNSSDASTGGALTYSTDLGVNFSTDYIQGVVIDVRNPRKKYLSIAPKWSTGRIYGIAVCYQGRRQGSTEEQKDGNSTGVGGFNAYKVYNWTT
jgi:hypothetical protein